MKSDRLKWHQAGCHRFTISPKHVPMTMGEAMAKTELNPYVCEHCIEGGTWLRRSRHGSFEEEAGPARVFSS
jgi:hypothetical protein